MKNKECGSCGFIGHPVHDEYGSLTVDVAVWVIGFVLSIVTGIIYLMVIGPMVSLWHIATFRSHRCPKCGNWDMHALDEHHVH